ncbi:MAG TPA: hypothetical protein ACYCC3_00385 [Candidatus Azoamicus sp.]
MKILFLECKNTLHIELFLIYMLKTKKINRILLINNIHFAIKVKKKILLLNNCFILIELTF